MLVLGIDPGSSGGLAIIRNSNNTLPQIILALRMPTVTIYGKKIIDTKKIATELLNMKTILPIDIWNIKDLSIINKLESNKK